MDMTSCSRSISPSLVLSMWKFPLSRSTPAWNMTASSISAFFLSAAVNFFLPLQGDREEFELTTPSSNWRKLRTKHFFRQPLMVDGRVVNGERLGDEGIDKPLVPQRHPVEACDHQRRLVCPILCRPVRHVEQACQRLNLVATVEHDAVIELALRVSRWNSVNAALVVPAGVENKNKGAFSG
ncbi:hypothetical protein N658DRAFT_249601 [Parathielavia hyrcaniae]|uniref:Uncharacterized protein n=1 Tax=Parathielavia hyrcaniae TaxID=113614 RepID=A0AAN6QBP2_9PEZI|nr:hypothetical protein N658DRAFT_249601 [Parathielavia hyrcaniae]